MEPNQTNPKTDPFQKCVLGHTPSSARLAHRGQEAAKSHQQQEHPAHTSQTAQNCSPMRGGQCFGAIIDARAGTDKIQDESKGLVSSNSSWD